MRNVSVIETLGASDLPEVQALLGAADLPTDDLADPAITLFGLRESGELRGVVGVQTCGEAGLLRSLAVRRDARSEGLGGRLCDRAFAHAREHGLAGMYLLTTGAAPYFEQRGFAVIARDQAPASIRTTAQFVALCPATAVVMFRPL